MLKATHADSNVNTTHTLWNTITKTKRGAVKAGCEKTTLGAAVNLNNRN